MLIKSFERSNFFEIFSKFKTIYPFEKRRKNNEFKKRRLKSQPRVKSRLKMRRGARDLSALTRVVFFFSYYLHGKPLQFPFRVKRTIYMHYREAEFDSHMTYGFKNQNFCLPLNTKNFGNNQIFFEYTYMKCFLWIF